LVLFNTRNAGYNEKEDVYYCPQGKKMYRVADDGRGNTLYRVHRHACRGCSYHGIICKAKRPSIKAGYNDELMKWVNGHLATGHAKQSLKERPHQVETAFAELKVPLGLARATLRGREKVQIQALAGLCSAQYQAVGEGNAERQGAWRCEENVPAFFFWVQFFGIVF